MFVFHQCRFVFGGIRHTVNTCIFIRDIRLYGKSKTRTDAVLNTNKKKAMYKLSLASKELRCPCRVTVKATSIFVSWNVKADSRLRYLRYDVPYSFTVQRSQNFRRHFMPTL